MMDVHQILIWVCVDPSKVIASGLTKLCVLQWRFFDSGIIEFIQIYECNPRLSSKLGIGGCFRNNQSQSQGHANGMQSPF